MVLACRRHRSGTDIASEVLLQNTPNVQQHDHRRQTLQQVAQVECPIPAVLIDQPGYFPQQRISAVVAFSRAVSVRGTRLFDREPRFANAADWKK